MTLGKNVVVLGGAGFIGRWVINELSKQGYHTKVAVRRPQRFRDYALFPNTRLVQLDAYTETSLAPVLAEADIVVNLLADMTAGPEAIDANDLAETASIVAKAISASTSASKSDSKSDSKSASKIARIVSVSQIGADAQRDSSDWLGQLGRADQSMLGVQGKHVTVYRAGLLLGEADHVVSAWKKQLARMPFLPLAKADTMIQPLFVRDFAQALVSDLPCESSFGEVREVAGEERLSVEQLGELVADLMEKESALVFGMCDLNAKLMSWFGPLAPIRSVSKQQMALLAEDSITDADFATQFGFMPRSIEQTLMTYVMPNGVRGRYSFYRQEAGRNSEDMFS